MPIRKLPAATGVMITLRSCVDPDHDPPKLIVLEPGTYEHTCPSCQKVTFFVVSPNARFG